ncbi:MAG TPA: sugar phosphate isomerase/epimerase family protein, partial [Verrucomicrobiae bacterium]|nr:sugar phosphate isomerase/epimerase family protein [Verrucomicrobiae bacterium]
RQFALAGSFAFAGFSSNLSAIEPFQRSGPARLRLSLAAYSFRQYFKDSDHTREKAVPSEKMIDMFQFIDYCAEQGCQGAEVTSYYFPKNVSTEFLLKLKRHAFLKGVELSGTSVGNTFTHPAGEKRDKQIKLVRQWIDYAAIMGAPHIRVFAGTAEGQSPEAARKNCLEALTECAGYAAEKGIFLGIENHGGIVAEPETLLSIIHEVKSPWVGINLDTANFHTADPYKDLAACAPYAVNVQVKTEISPRGEKKKPADLKRLLSILREANYQGYVALEYEADEDPYSAVPRALTELKQIL